MSTKLIVNERLDFFVVGNIAPTSILKTNEDWKISVSWSFHSNSLTFLSDYINIFWRLSVILEPLGIEKTSELNIAELDVSLDSGSVDTSSDLISYSTTIDIPSGKVPAGQYKPIVLIVLNAKNNISMNVSSFIESPRIEFQDPVKESKTQLFEDPRLRVDHIILSVGAGKRLSVPYLSNEVFPYIKAIADLQKFISRVQGLSPTEIFIISISQKSPISVSLQGASDALQVINDSVVPWRRKHAGIMARLQEQEKSVKIENMKAEVLEKRARAEKDRIEAKMKREEVERLRIENEKSRLELQRTKVQLGIDILQQVAENLSEHEKILWISELLPSLDRLILSELEVG